MEQHWKGGVAQKALIRKDGKVLVQQHPGFANMDLPGGRMNVGESPEAGIIREVQEELGVRIKLDGIVATYMYDIEGGLGEHLFIVYNAILENPEQEFIYQDGEVEWAKWVDPQELETLPMWKALRPGIEAFLKNHNRL